MSNTDNKEQDRDQEQNVMALPEYQSTQQVLGTASLSITPAELQGLITGMLSGGLSLDSQNWKVLLSDYANDGKGFPIKALETAEVIYALSLSELTSAGVELSLLLPEDDTLVNYADAVSEWVNHFISGLGLGGTQLSKMNGETKEALADLEEIAKLGIDEDDDMQEQALLLEQVVEHVKVCVLTIHSDLGARPLIENATVVSKTIH